VIRPDNLLTDSGFSITELDSVPGGIGLTAWLNETYAGLARDAHRAPTATNQQLSGRTAPAFCAFEPGWNVVGGAEGMLQGFGGIFGDAARVHIVVSQEAATYLPEMEWLAARLGHNRFRVQDAHFSNIRDGEAVYRFFELFDLANVPNAQTIFELAARGQLQVTPPPKPFFEEKMLLGLLWNRHLREFWRRALGEAFFTRLLDHIPYTWVVDGAPLPPQGVIPELNLSSWDQLKLLSQRQRDLILKLSGYSEHAWGARSVVLGSDVSATDWSAAVDRALSGFARTPYVLQRYHKPRLIEALWYDFGRGNVEKMVGRVRLCPYYFVVGSGDGARATLGGVLATICPADKKIIHGMRDAILAPCAT
jgi:hypothetical protein